MIRRTLLLRLAILAVALPAAGGAASPPACPAARYTLAAPLLPGGAGPGDGIEIVAGEVAVESGCGPVQAKLKGAKKGDKLSAKWASCGGLSGKVKISATLAIDCRTLTGTLKARKAKFQKSFSAALDEDVRECDFVPSAPTLAPLAAETQLVPRRKPKVRPDDPAFQEGLFRAIWSTVRDQYVTPDVNGVDWNAIFDEYLAKIQAGLTADQFYQTMRELIGEIGDDHSSFLSPADVVMEQQELAGGASFAGIGIVAQPIEGTQTVTLLAVFPNGPAAAAGLAAHDSLLEVDGLPVLDGDGKDRIKGDAGTSFTLTYRHPGGSPLDVAITRRTIGGFTPIDHCIIPGTRIGYLRMLSFLDLTADDRTRMILRKMTASSPLDGLIFDNRKNSGGASSVLLPELGFFTNGSQGRFVGPDVDQPLDVTAEDVGGSQSLPLVVLAGPDTISFGEIFTGVLQRSGRASVVGETTAGNVENLYRYGFVDGSVLWLAHATFEPVGLTPGAWEGVGIVPDALAPGSWDSFSEANDPALAAALPLLPSQ